MLTMKACLALTLGSYPKTFTGLLLSQITKHWSPNIPVSACEFNSIVVLFTAILFVHLADLLQIGARYSIFTDIFHVGVSF